MHMIFFEASTPTDVEDVRMIGSSAAPAIRLRMAGVIQTLPGLVRTTHQALMHGLVMLGLESNELQRTPSNFQMRPQHLALHSNLSHQHQNGLTSDKNDLLKLLKLQAGLMFSLEGAFPPRSRLLGG